jgi:hypothetical protein
MDPRRYSRLGTDDFSKENIKFLVIRYGKLEESRINSGFLV